MLALADDDPVVFRCAPVGDSREDLAASKFDASSALPGNQVLVGSGGSPFEMTTLAANEPVADRYYTWALVAITRSGRARLSTCGFDEQFGPTTRNLNRVRIQ